MDLICLSTSAPFTHENFECGYLGLKLPFGIAGSHRVFGECALDRREFVGGEACHHPPVDSYSVSSLIHILIRGNVLAAVVRGYSANVDGNVLDAPSVLLAR